MTNSETYDINTQFQPVRDSPPNGRSRAGGMNRRAAGIRLIKAKFELSLAC